MNDLSVIEAQRFRVDAITLQDEMMRLVRDEAAQVPDCPLTHRFIPPDAAYGCAVYAREILLPQGSLIIGKIHKHEHLAFLLKGKIIVATEVGRETLTAPQTFISPAGVKRVLYVEEEAIVTTVHLTKHYGEQQLAEIEDEVIAASYEEFDRMVSAKLMGQIGGGE